MALYCYIYMNVPFSYKYKYVRSIVTEGRFLLFTVFFTINMLRININTLLYNSNGIKQYLPIIFFMLYMSCIILSFQMEKKKLQRQTIPLINGFSCNCNVHFSFSYWCVLKWIYEYCKMWECVYKLSKPILWWVLLPPSIDPLSKEWTARKESIISLLTFWKCV